MFQVQQLNQNDGQPLPQAIVEAYSHSSYQPHLPPQQGLTLSHDTSDQAFQAGAIYGGINEDERTFTLQQIVQSLTYVMNQQDDGSDALPWAQRYYQQCCPLIQMMIMNYSLTKQAVCDVLTVGLKNQEINHVHRNSVNLLVYFIQEVMSMSLNGTETQRNLFKSFRSDFLNTFVSPLLQTSYFYQTQQVQNEMFQLYLAILSLQYQKGYFVDSWVTQDIIPPFYNEDDDIKELIQNFVTPQFLTPIVNELFNPQLNKKVYQILSLSLLFMRNQQQYSELSQIIYSQILLLIREQELNSEIIDLLKYVMLFDGQNVDPMFVAEVISITLSQAKSENLIQLLEVCTVLVMNLRRSNPLFLGAELPQRLIMIIFHQAPSVYCKLYYQRIKSIFNMWQRHLNYIRPQMAVDIIKPTVENLYLQYLEYPSDQLFNSLGLALRFFEVFTFGLLKGTKYMLKLYQEYKLKSRTVKILQYNFNDFIPLDQVESIAQQNTSIFVGCLFRMKTIVNSLHQQFPNVDQITVVYYQFLHKLMKHIFLNRSPHIPIDVIIQGLFSDCGTKSEIDQGIIITLHYIITIMTNLIFSPDTIHIAIKFLKMMSQNIQQQGEAIELLQIEIPCEVFDPLFIHGQIMPSYEQDFKSTRMIYKYLAHIGGALNFQKEDVSWVSYILRPLGLQQLSLENIVCFIQVFIGISDINMGEIVGEIVFKQAQKLGLLAALQELLTVSIPTFNYKLTRKILKLMERLPYQSNSQKLPSHLGEYLKNLLSMYQYITECLSQINKAELSTELLEKVYIMPLSYIFKVVILQELHEKNFIKPEVTDALPNSIFQKQLQQLIQICLTIIETLTDEEMIQNREKYPIHKTIQIIFKHYVKYLSSGNQLFKMLDYLKYCIQLQEAAAYSAFDTFLNAFTNPQQYQDIYVALLQSPQSLIAIFDILIGDVFKHKSKQTSQINIIFSMLSSFPQLTENRIQVLLQNDQAWPIIYKQYTEAQQESKSLYATKQSFAKKIVTLLS